MRKSSKGNPYHDKRGRFCSATNIGHPAKNVDSDYTDSTEKRVTNKKEENIKKKKGSLANGKIKEHELVSINPNNPSNHYVLERQGRKKTIDRLIKTENGVPCDCFEEVGNEKARLHIIYSNGIDFVIDKRERRIVTAKILRRKQALFLYKSCGRNVPRDMYILTGLHEEQKLHQK